MVLPNQVYTAFSFLGFVLCAIPFYWHLEAWNTGTCMYMMWTGLACLIQCVNSIVWHKNIIDRVPVYCDIVTRIQVGLNVAIPACGLCINRRLYNITNIKAVMTTRSDRRRSIIIDLLICIGIPLLQIAAEYVVSGHRYDIFEDFGPVFSIILVPQAFYLYYAWPLAIGCVSFVYCGLTVHSFYKRNRQFSQFASSNRNLNRSRYLRLMTLSSLDMIVTIPLTTYIVVTNAKLGVTPWTSWAAIHHDYSTVIQVPAFVWKADRSIYNSLELFRWILVACAFTFFAFFGFADEARQHYRLVYTSLASRMGISTASATLHGSSHATSSFPHMKSKGGVTVSVVTTGDKRDSTISISDQLSIPSISIASDYKPDLKITELSGSMASSSVDSIESESHPPEGYSAGTPSVALDLPDTIISVPRPYTSDVANAV